MPRNVARLTVARPPGREESPWLNPKEAAAYLGVGVDAIYEACASKGLKHVKLGHSTIRLRREWIDDWAERQARVQGETGGIDPTVDREG